MPEGPEIRKAADIVASAIQGKVIEEIEVGLPDLLPFVPDLIGSKVIEVETKGKAMINHFDNGLCIYSHNQLYGKWFTAKRGKYPNTNRLLRLALHTRTHSALLYSASDISVWKKEELRLHPLLSKLGPDVLSTSTTENIIKQRLLSKRFKNRALTSLYLDQHFLSGVGNYLRSEILFDSKLHPDKKPCELTEQELENLARSTIEITKRSYFTNGFTVPDKILETIQKPHSDYEGTRFMVFDREGLPCRICATPTSKATKNSRRVYWCKYCQP